MSPESQALPEIPAGPAQSPSRWKPLRIWPPVVLLTGMVVLRFLPSLVEDGPVALWMSAAFGPALCGILILVWWLAASRATFLERIAGLIGVILAASLTIALLDKSMIGPAMMVLTIPIGIAAFALGAIFCRRILNFKRTVVAVAMALVGFGFSTLFRCDGLWGNFALGLHFRWAPSAEAAVLRTESSRRATDVVSTNFALALAHPEWPGFRGPNRDGLQHGSMIDSDWKTNPQQLVWKIAVGPGWSSFAVAGQMLFTQEQRGADETVVCYSADSGREIWTHKVKSRFDDPLGGPGPRATPTLADGAMYVFGATGILQRLDPMTGLMVWETDVREVANRKPPVWGFSSSPLVVDSTVIVYAGGADDKGTLAFDTDDGKLKWSAAAGDHSYSSPQLATVADERVVLMLTNAGLNILDAATGAERLNHKWPTEGYGMLQPRVIDGDSILLASPMGDTRRLRISKSEGQLKADEVWISRDLKPEFNDFVVYGGHAYGFDSAIFACIDLETGKRKWKGGRYGKGQVLLQDDCGLLLVISEQGELVLLKADPTALTELGRFQAMTGKSWNHPVLIGDRLYVRNSEEAACYRLALTNSAATTP